MSAITLVITAAGRAALVNAATAGTNAVTITAAGFTSLAFAAAAGMTALPGEFKRITTLSGAVVDPDTIHLVLRDDSDAAYALRGLALYLSDGTLFALYGQTAPILEKSASATALLAIDVRFADITAASLAFGDANFLNPPATTSTAGVIELATNAEAATGSDTIRAITPAALKAVIDARFGAGAATAFARQLLAAADAPAVRSALQLRGAALKDEGHGNGLDADTVDGMHVSRGGAGGAWPCLPVVNSDGVMEVGRFIDFHNASNDPADFRGRLELQGALLFWSGAALWHAGNDGAGSGLDADLLDGQDSSFYTNIIARLGFTPVNRAGDVITGSLTVNASNTPGGGLILSDDGDLVDLNDGYLAVRFSSGIRIYTANKGGTPAIDLNSNGQMWSFGNRVWHAGNDGAGSGLDADLLDGRHSASFANASHTHTAADLAPAFSAAQLANDGWQELPGGLLLQWGRYRVYAGGESTVGIAFPRAFAAAPFTVQLTGVNPSGATNRDMFPQLQGSDAGGALVRLQQPDSGSARPLDGFDWFAIGLAGTGPGAVPGTGGSGGGGGGGGALV